MVDTWRGTCDQRRGRVQSHTGWYLALSAGRSIQCSLAKYTRVLYSNAGFAGKKAADALRARIGLSELRCEVCFWRAVPLDYSSWKCSGSMQVGLGNCDGIAGMGFAKLRTMRNVEMPSGGECEEYALVEEVSSPESAPIL